MPSLNEPMPDAEVLAIAELYVNGLGSETVRSVAKKMSYSHSVIHYTLRGGRLKKLDPDLFELAQEVLAMNKADRNRRAGEATRQKYLRALEGLV